MGPGLWQLAPLEAGSRCLTVPGPSTHASLWHRVLTSLQPVSTLLPVYTLRRRFGRRRPFLSSVGRLDKDTSGLLLLTDDGQLLHSIQSPAKGVTHRPWSHSPGGPGVAGVSAVPAVTGPMGQ